MAAYQNCCGNCGTFCSGDAPEQLKVILRDIENEDCTECTSVNGTYTVDYLTQTPAASPPAKGDGCYYKYTFPSTICGVSADPLEYIAVRLSYNALVASNYAVQVILVSDQWDGEVISAAPINSDYWLASGSHWVASKPDCSDLGTTYEDMNLGCVEWNIPFSTDECKCVGIIATVDVVNI